MKKLLCICVILVGLTVIALVQSRQGNISREIKIEVLRNGSFRFNGTEAPLTNIRERLNSSNIDSLSPLTELKDTVPRTIEVPISICLEDRGVQFGALNLLLTELLKNTPCSNLNLQINGSSESFGLHIPMRWNPVIVRSKDKWIVIQERQSSGLRARDGKLALPEIEAEGSVCLLIELNTSVEEFFHCVQSLQSKKIQYFSYIGSRPISDERLKSKFWTNFLELPPAFERSENPDKE